MKNFKKYILTVLLILSVMCNALLCFYLLQAKKPVPSIVKFGYDKHNTVIYCEKAEDVNTVKLDTNKNIFTIGDSKLLSAEDALYFITPEEKIKLTDYEGSGFIVNSKGELLYSLNTPAKKQETVYITPSGKKYHKDAFCAGKTGFEINIETAKLLREPCNICA